MLLIESNSSDIQKYYEGSWIKLREFGDKPFFVQKVTREGVYFTDVDNEEGIIYLSDDVPYELNMVLPNKAAFQYNGYAYLMARIPARQYHRGITTANCIIQRLDSEGWRKASLNGPILSGYMGKPNYRELDDVIEACKNSEALSSRFSYQASSKRIYCDTMHVATVNPSLKFIGCKAILVPEITKLLSNNSKYEVVPT